MKFNGCTEGNWQVCGFIVCILMTANGIATYIQWILPVRDCVFLDQNRWDQDSLTARTEAIALYILRKIQEKRKMKKSRTIEGPCWRLLAGEWNTGSKICCGGWKPKRRSRVESIACWILWSRAGNCRILDAIFLVTCAMSADRLHWYNVSQVWLFDCSYAAVRFHCI